jgi:hypothetical protein
MRAMRDERMENEEPVTDTCNWRSVDGITLSRYRHMYLSQALGLSPRAFHSLDRETNKVGHVSVSENLIMVTCVALLREV